MTEYERVREQIAESICVLIFDKKRPSLIPMWEQMLKGADQILSLNGIEIRADDQNLPEIIASDISPRRVRLWQQDMLKAGFIKVAPKEE